MARRKKNSNIQIDYNTWILLIVCILFYLSFCFVFGVYLSPDSEGYIAMISAREPVYPLLLAFFRKLFGEENYLKIVILFQNIQMALAVWLLVVFMKRRYFLTNTLVYVLLGIHFGVACLCQFAAGRSSIYTNSILTEGITMSLWLFFVLAVLYLLETKRLIYEVIALALAAIMMDTRKQMAIAYLVLFAVLLLFRIGEEKYWKKMGISLGLICISLLLALGGNRLYNYSLRGEFAQNTRDMNLVLTTSLYVADREDADLIEEENVRTLFLQVYDLLDAKECNYKYAQEGWRNLESHYGAHYDMITIETTQDLFPEYARSLGFAEGMEAEQEADRMSKVIVRSLLKDNFVTYAKVYFASMGNGFVNTVAKKGTLFDAYALVAYLVYLILLAICFHRRDTRDVAWMGLTVFICIVVNVGVTAALIFCQTRYMIYNMALFYMALLIMGFCIIRNKED